eukprot:gene4159-2196_t
MPHGCYAVDDEHELMAGEVKARARESEAWKVAWHEVCAQRRRAGGGSVGRDPSRHTKEVLLHALETIDDADPRLNLVARIRRGQAVSEEYKDRWSVYVTTAAWGTKIDPA